MRGNILARHLLFEISGFFGVFRAFSGVFLVFLGVFRVVLGCSGFSWGFPGFLGCVPGFLGGVPGFSVVPECSVMFRCSGVPVFLEVLHATLSNNDSKQIAEATSFRMSLF